MWEKKDSNGTTIQNFLKSPTSNRNNLTMQVKQMISVLKKSIVKNGRYEVVVVANNITGIFVSPTKKV